MTESDNYSEPEYSDDDIEKKPRKKKPVKEVKDEKMIILPSQMGYKTKDQFASKIPPPLDFSENPQFCDGKNGTRNERGEEFGEFEKPKKIASTIEKSWKNEKFGGSEKVKVKHKPMVSSNFRPALQGTDFINDDDIKIYYQNVNSAINIKPCFDLKETEIFKSFSKSPSAPECRRFLDSTLVRNLSDKEINKIRPIQAAMMTAVFTYPRQNPDTSKADILATSKTGSGKTLAFLIPLLQKAIERRDIQPNKNQRIPMALIFVNSTELAMSVFHVLRELLKGLRLKVVVMAASLNFIEDTNFDIGICTNGRFQNHFGHTLTLGDKAVALDLRELEYIVIDEADKMVSDLKFVTVLKQLKKEPSKPRIFAFTATLDADTAQIMRYSSIFQIKCGQHNVIPPNIKQFFWEVKFKAVSRLYRTRDETVAFHEIGNYCDPPHPFDVLYKALTEAPLLHRKRTLVFVKRTCIADYIAIRLDAYGIPAVSIHRQLVDVQTPIDMFNKGEVNVAIVTQYFTRGIDTEVDVVINYDLPIIAADFIHRCGRTGRNGNIGIAITFIDFLDPENYNPDVIEQIIESMAKRKDIKIPTFLQPRVDAYKEWNLPMEK